MGNCCGSPPPSSRPLVQHGSRPRAAEDHVARSAGEGGHNRPLRPERPVWNAPEPVTRREILRMRNEFWDTAPSFEGRREIWDALRAACETADVAFAQAVLDSAHIKLPTGVLTTAYDELGNKYTIPVFCLSFPNNVIDADVMPEASVAAIAQREGQPLPLKVRLSIGQDLQMDFLTTTTAREVRALVAERARLKDAVLMVMFCGKRLGEMTSLEHTGIAQSDVLQVYVFPKK